MELRPVKSYKDWMKIKKLYMTAFPDNEKKPFWMIKKKYRQKVADVWVLEKEKCFSGMAITVNAGDLVLLDYFAVSEEKRGQGIGSQALKLLQAYYKGRRFFLEIESVYEPSDNLQERQKRKEFYLANDMQELGVSVKLFGVNMELLGYGCMVSFEEYRELYYQSFGSWAADKIVQVILQPLS